MAYQPNCSTSSTLTTTAPSSGSARETSGDSPRSRTYATPPPAPALERGDRGDRDHKEEINGIKDHSVARTATQAAVPLLGTWFFLNLERFQVFCCFCGVFVKVVG